MKQIFALIFTVVLFGVSAFGQNNNDTVLVQGDPPLTRSMVDQLIDLFEFGLHSKFTAAQRAEFQRYRVAEWQNNDEESKKNTVGLVAIRSQLMALNDEQLKEAQTKLQNYLVESFGKQPDEPTAKLLLAVYKGGVNSDSASTVPAGSTNVGALLGTWGTGSVSGIGFYNTATGSTTNGGGTQVLYTFKPDGTYEYASSTTQNNYSCHTDFSTFKTGVVEIRGDVLTFIPKTSKFTSRDSCSARNNYEKPAGLERETYNWSVGRDESGVKLCLQNATVNGCAYKR